MRRRSLFLIVLVTVLLLFTIFSCAKKTTGVFPFPTDKELGGPQEVAPGGGREKGGELTPAESKYTSTVPGLPGFERKIIQSGFLFLRVESVEKTMRKISDIANKYRGYVLSSGFNTYQDIIKGSIEIRVINSEFNNAFLEISSLGTVLEKNTSSSDVTEEYVDLQSRLKILKAEEERLLSFLTKAKDVKEMLAIEEYLKNVRIEIESIEGRKRYLDNLTTLATIRITLEEVLPQPTGSAIGFFNAFKKSLIQLKENFSNFLTWLGLNLINIIIGVVLLVIIYVIFKPVFKKAIFALKV